MCIKICLKWHSACWYDTSVYCANVYRWNSGDLQESSRHQPSSDQHQSQSCVVNNAIFWLISARCQQWAPLHIIHRQSSRHSSTELCSSRSAQWYICFDVLAALCFKTPKTLLKMYAHTVSKDCLTQICGRSGLTHGNSCHEKLACKTKAKIEYIEHSCAYVPVSTIWVSVCLLPAPLLSTPLMIRSLNQHDPSSVLVNNSFALIVCWEVSLWHKLRSEIIGSGSSVKFAFSSSML